MCRNINHGSSIISDGGYWVSSSGNVTDEVGKKYIEDQKPEEPDDNVRVV
jgi:hypothetical protein